MKTTKSKDGTTLAYNVYGSGPALIYITGAICFRKFDPVVKDAKVFASEFSVYNYDRRGRGDSSNTQPYSIEREIEDIEAIIDAAGGSAFLYGHSSGAVLALEAALRLPSKVMKVALFDASYVHNETEKQEYSVLRQEVLALLHNGKNSQALKRFLIGIGIPKVFVYLLPLMPGWSTMKALAPTLEYDMLLTCDLPPLARAAQIKIATHVMYGEKSPAGIHDVAKHLAEAIPDAKLSKLAGQDHMVNPKALLPFLIS
ncbi:putative hydrolase [compost metagenome]